MIQVSAFTNDFALRYCNGNFLFQDSHSDSNSSNESLPDSILSYSSNRNLDEVL